MLRQCLTCNAPFDCKVDEAHQHCHAHRKKQCACGVLFMHPDSDQCGVCGGRACKHCGNPKTKDKPLCGKPACAIKENEANKLLISPPRVVKFAGGQS